jgi:hypothetical protein
MKHENLEEVWRVRQFLNHPKSKTRPMRTNRFLNSGGFSGINGVAL